MGYASSGEEDITWKVGYSQIETGIVVCANDALLVSSWSVGLKEFGFFTKNFAEQHVGQAARA